MKMRKYIVCFLMIASTCMSIILQAQDSISYEDLAQFAYSFNMDGDKWKGEGGEVLSDAIASSNITVLAENLGSKLEHEFTQALITSLDQNGYNKMVLEVGGGSGSLINRLARNSQLNTNYIKTLNQKYLLKKGERTFVPITELQSSEALGYLSNAVDRGWQFLSVGIEPWTSYKMHIDELYGNLNKNNKEANQDLYHNVSAFLDEEYNKVKAYNTQEVHRLMTEIENYKPLYTFLDKAMVCDGNKDIVDAFRQSIEYWAMYGNQEFYKKNMWSAAEDKLKLKQDLESIDFDFGKDKLFVKMWRNHVSKGFSPSGTHGIGNMLEELADYHGTNSLIIGVVRRFSTEDGVLVDAMIEQDRYTQIFKDLVQLGDKDKWQLIDLRPFVQHFYYDNYMISEGLYRMMARYDMLVIPPADEAATPNY